ncbi:MAG: AAA family ATPase, partial [Bdellovibrionales bacterium]|nr:AAA family ATPase [Bdellovibrionales bacterium]
TEETRAELESLEKSLVSLQRDKNILASPEVLIKLNNVFVDEKTHLEEIKRKYKASELFLSQISFEINKLREEMASDGNTSQLYLSQAQRRFDLLKYQLAVEQIGRQPSSVSNQGEIVSLTSELNTYKSILRNSKGGSIALDPWKQLQEFESLLAETKKNKAQLASEIQAARTSMRLSEAEHDDIPEAFRQISELQRNIQLTTEIYTMLRTRLAETQIQEAGRSNDLTIMSYADRSRKPTEVGIVKKGVIAGFGGFSLSIMGLFLFYILIPTIRNKSDLEKIGIKVVGEYNLYRSPHSRILGDKTKPLVFVESAGGSEANAIRYTRFRIEKALKINRSLSAPEARVISVCSVNTGEGKTFSISNLAYSFAMADIKTLLFDCDFEKDDLRNYFREMRKPDELAIINDDENIKFERNFIFKNLHLLRICDSSVNLLDYLESTKFHQFLESLRSEYDVIIIDSPPIKGH